MCVCVFGALHEMSLGSQSMRRMWAEKENLHERGGGGDRWEAWKTYFDAAQTSPTPFERMSQSLRAAKWRFCRNYVFYFD